jgi:hypothetical protein
MNTNLNKKILLCVTTLILSGGLPQLAVAQDAEPLKILQITGGGPWHDYATQKDQISEGLLERLANVEVTTDYEGADIPVICRKTGRPSSTLLSTTNVIFR